MTTNDVRRRIRESLGLPVKKSVPTLPQEGHICDFPIWSYSKHRAHVTKLRIDYEDGSFFSLSAPEGMPSPCFPGFLDCILFYGQKDLFLKGMRDLLGKAPEDVSPEKRLEPYGVLADFPELRLAHSLVHWLRRWYDLPDVQMARARLRAWLYRIKKAEMNELGELAATIGR